MLQETLLSREEEEEKPLLLDGEHPADASVRAQALVVDVQLHAIHHLPRVVRSCVHYS